MMTAMISLAALTHAAPAPAFNGLFYATAATIIPVLFVALAVQGRGYENLMKTFDTMDERSDHDISRTQAAAFVATGVLVTIATLILASAVLSEILAVYALYQQQARSTTGWTILISVILLTIATAATPALTYLRYYIRSEERKLERTKLKALNAAARKTNPAAPSHPDTQDQPDTEPGKTDTP
jgi:hypothetical protein